MTQNFIVSLFKHKRDTTPRNVERSWQRLCSNFQKPQVRYEKDGALFCPAIFEPAYRLKINVREVSLLVLDIDHHAELERLKKQISMLNAAYIIYSTHSHLRRTENNPNAEPRFRVCLPLSKPIPASRFSALWQYTKRKTLLPLDESAKDESRMFYTPAIAEKDAPYIFFLNEGEFLDWQKLPLESFTADEDSNDGEPEPQETKETLKFEFHEDRHTELCRRIETQAAATGRGTFEMKCPAHNGNGNSSLFYDPKTGTAACLKKPNACTYFELLKTFGLPNEKLPSREHQEKLNKDLEETEIKVKPFPVPNEKCFHGLAGDYVRFIEPHTEADKMALLIQFLAYFGNIIGRSAFYQVEGSRHFTNLFCVLVGDTASGRKGTSLGRVKEVFKDLDELHQKNCVVSGLASGEGLIYHVRDACYVTKQNKETGELEEILADSGVSDKRLFVTEGEFAQVLRVQGRDGNSLSANVRNFWDTGNAQNLTKNSPLKTTDAHVSIVGHITKTELLTCLSEVESSNGYANRFLWICVKRSKLLPFGSEVDYKDLLCINADISRRIEFAQKIEQLYMSDEAKEFWASIYEHLETSRFGFVAKVTQRASPYVLRLSCIFALLDAQPVIGRGHLEAGLAVWQYCEDSVKYIFGERIGNKNADAILDALRDAENGLTRTEIYTDIFQKNLNAKEINKALQILLETGLIETHTEQTENAKKPSEKWFAKSSAQRI